MARNSVVKSDQTVERVGVCLGEGAVLFSGEVDGEAKWSRPRCLVMGELVLRVMCIRLRHLALMLCSARSKAQTMRLACVFLAGVEMLVFVKTMVCRHGAVCCGASGCFMLKEVEGC